ncbi:hypothetical protein [Planomonospora parontospora]|uniref:hypothetical protein n=1 Tax=Planomonospora parontospora TaxID=58119 RepID=UPI0016708048|nr:hypothetical protein [Planomonospora parontospora]GGL33909.1 hypothetical protein GCM10014719_38900 [Planomonospora parontospora subsp. antibiotica]GII17117.1 hypothetical protein Ppa05_38430 [Planomonospora parontospora subsp. antibiotica]
MTATAFAVALTIIALAMTAQDRAQYQPQARPGTLLVRSFSAEETAAVRAAVQRELPGVPVVQRDVLREHGPFGSDIENVELPDLESVSPSELIGDRALLHYLTGDPSTPYDEGTAVVVTAADVEVDEVTIHYDLSGKTDSLQHKTIPAIAAKPAAPHLETIFLPAEVVRGLGYHLDPEELIIDPSAHRTSVAEQERLDGRLGDAAVTYVERGFQEPTGWRIVAASAAVIALGWALAVPGRTVAASRSRRVLLRLGGSAATLRLFTAFRTGLGAACGAVTGVAAGCVIGLLLAWPMTYPASSGWEPVPRVAFDTPWPLLAVPAAVLPVLAAAVAGLLPLRRSAAVPSVRR